MNNRRTTRLPNVLPVSGVGAARPVPRFYADVSAATRSATACSTAGGSYSDRSGIGGSSTSLEIGLVGYRPVFVDPTTDSRRDLVAVGGPMSAKNADPSIPAVGFKEVETHVDLLHDVTLAFDLQSSNVNFDE